MDVSIEPRTESFNGSDRRGPLVKRSRQNYHMSNSRVSSRPFRRCFRPNNAYDMRAVLVYIFVRDAYYGAQAVVPIVVRPRPLKSVTRSVTARLGGINATRYYLRFIMARRSIILSDV